MSNNLLAAKIYYDKAYAAGIKEGGSPAVLKNVLSEDGISGTSTLPLGILQIPIEQIRGTYDEGRRGCFSEHFYPIMDKSSEFAAKWIALCSAHLDEGIRDPVKAYEYLGQYYIIEGNKRVSVLAFFDSVTVTADVIRIIPPLHLSESSEKIQINYEYIDFFNFTGINYIYFDTPCCFSKLIRLTGKGPGDIWTPDEQKDFSSLYTAFRDIFQKQSGNQSYQMASSAFLAFISVYDYRSLLGKSISELKELIIRDMPEIRTAMSGNPVDLQTDPKEAKASLFSHILGNTPESLKIGFINAKNIRESGWAYGHELARRQLESTFSGKIETRLWEDTTADSISDSLGEAISSGCNLIFTTSAIFLKESIRAAVEHPEIKILNCSLNKPQRSVRIYSARMYEVKFLMGAIAATLSDNHRVGYIADYPIYGATAGVNAFAFGAQMIDPNIKVYLTWSKLEDLNIDEFLWNNQLSVVCGKDSGIGLNDRRYGLYKIVDGKITNIAVPVWNWAVFYEKIVQSVLNNTWKNEESKDSDKGISYWWGMSSGIVNLIYSRELPIGTLRLIGNLRQALTSGALSPFRGPLLSQDRKVQTGIQDVLELPDIMTMDWLAENIIGEIPSAFRLTPEGQIMAEVQSVKLDETLM